MSDNLFLYEVIIFRIVGCMEHQPKRNSEARKARSLVRAARTGPLGVLPSNEAGCPHIA